MMATSRHRFPIAAALLALLLVAPGRGVLQAQGLGAAITSSAKPAFTFRGAEYFHRWSKDEQHEFTPAKQEDLQKWTDMMTLHAYKNVRDGDALAAQANAILESYKKARALVLKTDSVPRTPTRPAEHLIAVVFGRAAFIEVVFARIRLVDGVGCAAIYSHRMYGEKIGDQMSAWIKENAETVEKSLMQWDSMPSPAALSVEAL